MLQYVDILLPAASFAVLLAAGWFLLAHPDTLRIARRTPLLYIRWFRYPATALPWARCHCGALAELQIFGEPASRNENWCSRCRFKCECRRGER